MADLDFVQHVKLKKYLYHKAAVKGIPISVNFELTPICNFNCKMCYVHQSEEQVKKHSRPMMRLNDWINLAEKLKEQGTLYILLTGGEPLLWPDFWELYEALYKMGFLILINTNGSMLTDSVIERLKRMPPNQVNITLYGASDQTYYNLCGIKGVFTTVVNAIDTLRKTGIPLRINGTITPYNVSDIEEIISFANEKRIPFKSTTYMFPPIRRNKTMIGVNNRFTPEEAAFYKLKIAKLQMSEKKYYAYLQMIKTGRSTIIEHDDDCMDKTGEQMQCLAGRASCWITWDGYLGLCGMIPDFYFDLKNSNFETAWKELKLLSEKIFLSSECTHCNDSVLCHKCAAIAYAETGNVDGIPDYVCRTTKELKKLAELELKNYRQ